MPNRWQWLSVEDIAAPHEYSCIGGPFGSKLTRKDYVSSGVPVSRGSNLDLSSQKFIDDDFVFVTEDKANKLEKHTAYPLDLIFTQRGTIGQIAIIPSHAKYERYVLSQNQMKLTVDKQQADTHFVYYYFISPSSQNRIQRNAIGSTIPGFNLTQLRAFPILLPPLPEQREIAHILGSLDDKIEANRRQNATLEATARAIFKSWFVDFDPVHAKARGEAPAGMDADTAALFPDTFEDSDLGPIPAGWSVCTLTDVAEVNRANIRKDYPHAVIEYIDLSSVSEGQFYGTTSYRLNEAPSRAKRLVQHGDTIWGTVRPNRRSYYFIHQPIENLVASTGFVVLSPRIVPPDYLYFWTTSDTYVEYLIHNATGSAYPAVNQSRFKQTEMIYPTENVLRAFDQIASSMRDKIHANENESRTLAETRDALLPRLISGELRVGEV